MWDEQSFSQNSFSQESWLFGSIANGGVCGTSSGGTGWDGKIYYSPDMVIPKPRDRVYFNESQARVLAYADETIEAIKHGEYEQEALFTVAANTIKEIKEEINTINAANYELQKSEKEKALKAKIEEIDAAFMLFVIATMN